MGHIKLSMTRAERTQPEWLRVGAQLGELVNTWAGRSDIVAYVGPGAGGPAPACFNPPMAEVEVNVDVAFGVGVSPETIGDIRNRTIQFNYPRGAGAIFHEALHARYSRYDLLKISEDKEVSRNVFDALTLLEETRIEALGVENYPNNRVFLRACAMDIILEDIKSSLAETTTTRSMGRMAGLVLARVDAGSLDADDVLEVKELLLNFFGTEVLAQLRDVWLRFQKHELHSDPTNLIVLAKEWDDIISKLAEDKGDDEAPLGEKGILILMDGPLGEVMDALEEASEEIAISVNDEAQDQEQAEEWKDVVDMRGLAAKQQRDHERTANEVFAKATGETAGTKTHSRIKETRNPTGPERAAAVKIAQLLEKAKYRERDEKEIKSILPPGRLRTRAMVQEAAYRVVNPMMHAEPWRRTVRRHTDDPTLNVGVMVDISGSMASAMEPMAATAWAMSEAVRRVQGRCAMVYYGQDVFPTLKPGQHLDQVTVYTAPDGTEKFDKAFKALDGSLNLLNGTGARLLVIVSDGCYTDDERSKAKAWVRACEKAGVAVLWIPFEEGRYARGIAGPDTVILSDVRDPAEAAVQIGSAAAKALTKIGQRAA